MTVKCICMHFGNFWCKSVSVNWRSVFQWLNLFFCYQNCHQSPSTKMNQRLYTVTLVRDVFFSGQLCKYARRSGIMASALDFASRGLGLRLGWVSVFVLRQNTLVSACLSPPRSIKRYWWIVREAWRNAGGGPLRWTSIPSRGGEVVILLVASCFLETRINSDWVGLIGLRKHFIFFLYGNSTRIFSH